jgi:hypothetical protein
MDLIGKREFEIWRRAAVYRIGQFRNRTLGFIIVRSSSRKIHRNVVKEALLNCGVQQTELSGVRRIIWCGSLNQNQHLDFGHERLARAVASRRWVRVLGRLVLSPSRVNSRGPRYGCLLTKFNALLSPFPFSLSQ